MMGRRVAVGLTSVALIAPASLAGAASASSTAKHHYPSGFATGFQPTCTKAAKKSAGKKLTKKQASAYCKASLACIEDKLSYKDFVAALKLVTAGKSSSDVKKIVACEKAAAKKVTSS